MLDEWEKNQRTPSEERSERIPSVIVAERNHDTSTSSIWATASMMAMRETVFDMYGVCDYSLSFFIGIKVVYVEDM